MRLVGIVLVALLLGACAPGVYVLEWNPPRAYSGVVERIVEVPVYVEVPVGETPITNPVLPPAPPVDPPVLPPAPPEPPTCTTQDMPPKSPFSHKVKCPGEPAVLVRK
jgi:hypothetical protein